MKKNDPRPVAKEYVAPLMMLVVSHHEGMLCLSSDEDPYEADNDDYGYKIIGW